MEYYIYLNAPEYLAQFVKHNFGDPVELIRDSPESRILREYLAKTPEDYKPEEETYNIRIRIPCFKEKDPRVYNYISSYVKQSLVDSFEELFKRSMWGEIGALGNLRCKTVNIIYSYMERNGVDQRHWETVSKKWYRLRKTYLKEKGITVF
jgi:hypothetical protein